MFWGLKINISNRYMWCITHVVSCPLPGSGVCLTRTQGKVNSRCVCAGSTYRTDLTRAVWEQVWRVFHFQLLLKHVVSCLGCCVSYDFLIFFFQEELITFAKNWMTCQLSPARLEHIQERKLWKIHLNSARSYAQRTSDDISAADLQHEQKGKH